MVEFMLYTLDLIEALFLATYIFTSLDFCYFFLWLSRVAVSHGPEVRASPGTGSLSLIPIAFSWLYDLSRMHKRQ